MNPLNKGLLLFLSFISLSGIIASPHVRGSDGPEKISNAQPAWNLGARFARFYQETFSAVDGDRCPSFPSCSQYSLEAFQKHGLFMGWMMTVDRLFHEGTQEGKVSPLVFESGRWKIYDPVENNDFWWYRQDENDHD